MQVCWNSVNLDKINYAPAYLHIGSYAIVNVWQCFWVKLNYSVFILKMHDSFMKSENSLS